MKELSQIVELAKADEAEQSGPEAAMMQALMQAKVLKIPADVNWARDADTVQLIRDEVCSLVDDTRQQRIPFNEQLHQVLNMELMEHDDGQRYTGRSDAYLPVWNRNKDTLTANLSRGLFPSDDYMTVKDRRQLDPHKGKRVKQYLQYQFDVVSNLRSKMKPFLGQLASYGTAVLKKQYKKQMVHTGKMKKLGMDLGYEFGPSVCYDGLMVSTRSLFNWYVYPWTADCMEEAVMTFEDMQIHRNTVREMRDKGRWHKDACDALLAGGTTQPEFDYSQQRHLLSHMDDPTQPEASDRFGAMLNVTEIWTYLPLPRGAYLDGEDVRPVPVKIVVSGNHVLECIRNPFFEQKAPYDVARVGHGAGLFYGRGYGWKVRWLQYLANDFTNQTNDAGNYALNPIVKAMVGGLAGPLGPIFPGATYYLHDPNALSFDRPPGDITQYGMQLSNWMVSMGQDFGGAPPIMQGSGAGGRAKTATGSQILQNNASIPIQDLVQDIERDVMVPLMRSTWMLGKQYADRDVVGRIVGEDATQMFDKSELDIDAEFSWMASSQAMNQQARAQQAIQLLQIIAPLVPLLQQVGKMVDPTPVLERLYTDGFGFRGFDQFIKDVPQMPQMPGMPGGQPGMPGVPGAQEAMIGTGGDRVRSAVEQAAGGSGSMAPGEGGEFMGVREDADELAAMMGAMGGAPIDDSEG